uniref:Uncharacterized protein n=1 Tax=Acrobeloides nanus TaxID=290746 RepID=A0A914C3E6_9BILA
MAENTENSSQTEKHQVEGFVDEIKTELESQLDKEITELEKKVESAEALKKEREEEFKEAQKELVFMKNENTWEEEQCQFLKQANNELEDRAKSLEEELNQVNEDTEKMINFLSEIRKLHRHQEDLINQVYLQDEVWKTIEEMRFGDGASMAVELQNEADKLVTEVAKKQEELDKSRVEIKRIEAKVRSLIVYDMPTETKKVVIASMNEKLRNVQKLIVKYTMENRKIDMK